MALFGKKAFQIKFDKNTLKNVVKNFSAPGQIAGAAQALGVTKSNLVDDLFGGKKGGGGGGAAGPEKQDLTQKYMGAQEEQRLKNLETSGQLTEQLKQQAMGEGPLAGAQLKTAQTRNLAQTLAAAQSAGGNPLAQRQMLQQRGAQGQELAQLGMQERLGAQQALGAQIGQQAGMSRADIESAYGIGMTPEKMAHERAMQQAQIQAQKDMAQKQQQSQILGGVLGAAGSFMMSDEQQKEKPEEKKDKKSTKQAFGEALKSFAGDDAMGKGLSSLGEGLASVLKTKQTSVPTMPQIPGGMRLMMSDVEQKTTKKGKQSKEELPSAENEVNEMMDNLEPKKYQYKNPNAPGAAKGTRYGITAQDLEKSSLGKTLVKNTPHGKMVDTVQGFGAVLAAQSELNRRLKKVEKKGK